MLITLIDPQLGPDDARVVPVLENHGLDSYVPSGATIDVPAEVAGVGPHWRAPKDGDDLNYLRQVGFLTFEDDGSIKGVYDLGRGLLAQVDAWGKAEAPEAEQIASTEGEAK
jgi:hypothetical protein